MTKQLQLGLCQILVGKDKKQNLLDAEASIKEAVSKGANVVMLPECFNSPYSTRAFPEFQESIPEVGVTPSVDMYYTCGTASGWAKEHGIYLIAGSIPELGEDGKTYNTCVVYNPDGMVVAKHRKVHLFDIDIPGKITFKESDTLTAGKDVTMFDIDLARLGCGTGVFKVGVGICYDIRFPEYALLCRQKGAQMIVYPGAFNMTTGPAHWELLQRGRAVDTQCYVSNCSPARSTDPNPSIYKAWGHSSIVNPWGEVIATTDEKPSVVVAPIDIASIDQVRENMPLAQQKRYDLYTMKLNTE